MTDIPSTEEMKEVVESIQRIDLAPCSYFLSTGCTILDLAIADRLPGGFGGGRVSHIYGEESTAKTVLITEVLGSAQRQGGTAYFEDAEFTFDFPRAGLFGINVEDPKFWQYATPRSIEELFDSHIHSIIKSRRATSTPGVVGVDSLSALPSSVEEKGKLGEASYGTSRAKVLSEAFRKYLCPMNRANLASVFVDQAREDPTVVFGDPLTVSGGRALKFYASTRLKVSHAGVIKNSRELPVGVNIRFKVVKNKISPPHRDGVFRIIFDYGIDDIGTSLEWLRKWDEEEYAEYRDAGRKPYVFAGEKKRSLNLLIAFVENNNLEEEVRKRVETIWRQLYQPTKNRSPKKRWN